MLRNAAPSSLLIRKMADIPAAPVTYVNQLVALCDPVIRQAFALEVPSPTAIASNLSLVTTAPDKLHPLQQIPHIDTGDPARFALLHYLFAGPLGGTAFFRQVATGFEQVTPEARMTYLEQQRRDLAALPPVATYPDTETPGYQRIAHVEPRLNRLIIYRSCTLHSGVIPSAAALSSDPRKGRLTANIFVEY
jgi:hypothetical protein